MAEFVTRSFDLADAPLEVARSVDGRTLVGYVAAFDQTAEIHDKQGHYIERNAPGAFDKTLAERNGNFRVHYNHGMTMYGTPSERFALPIGVPKDVRADGYGVRTETLLNRGELEDSIIEGVRSGSIRGMSYSGRFIQSDPRMPRGGYRPSRSGELTVVTRKEVAMTEFGPTATPAFDAAHIIGVRALVDRIEGLTADERAQLIDLLQADTTELSSVTRDEPMDADTSTEAVQPQEPVDDHSAARQIAWNRFQAELIARGIR